MYFIGSDCLSGHMKFSVVHEEIWAAFLIQFHGVFAEEKIWMSTVLNRDMFLYHVHDFKETLSQFSFK